MKLHIFRLSGHDFVHYRKIEIGANDRAVYQQSISCFIVYANFDWFLINLFIFFILIHFLVFSITFLKNLRAYCTYTICPQSLTAFPFYFKQQANSSLRGWVNFFTQYPTQSVPKIARYFVKFYSSL